VVVEQVDKERRLTQVMVDRVLEAAEDLLFKSIQ
jgi:hypothetical protein